VQAVLDHDKVGLAIIDIEDHVEGMRLLASLERKAIPIIALTEGNISRQTLKGCSSVYTIAKPINSPLLENRIAPLLSTDSQAVLPHQPMSW
jgi:DNA-binding response OmpR family regulator